MKYFRVSDSELSHFFEPGCPEDILVLSNDEATRQFSHILGEKVKSYFDLPSHHWIVNSKRSDIGDWINAFNEGDRSPVIARLKKNFSWDKSEQVFFLGKRKTVIQSSWESFLMAWDSFIACEDDCPIVLPISSRLQSQALIFLPIGRMVMIEREHVPK